MEKHFQLESLELMMMEYINHLSQGGDLQIVALIVIFPIPPPFNISTACTASVL